jgi:hypothetical protein
MKRSIFVSVLLIVSPAAAQMSLHSFVMHAPSSYARLSVAGLPFSFGHSIPGEVERSKVKTGLGVYGWLRTDHVLANASRCRQSATVRIAEM